MTAPQYGGAGSTTEPDYSRLHGGSLKSARTYRLGLAKASPEYRGLATIEKRIVDHLARKYENPINGAFPRQTTLAERFGVARGTMNRYLRNIEKAGVLTKEIRHRGAGSRGGRTSNSYRLNPDLLRRQMALEVTQPVTQPATQPVTAEGTSYQPEAMQVEGASPQGEALPQVGHLLLAPPAPVGAEDFPAELNDQPSRPLTPNGVAIHRAPALPWDEPSADEAPMLPWLPGAVVVPVFGPDSPDWDLDMHGATRADYLRAETLRQRIRHESWPAPDRIGAWRELDALLGPLSDRRCEVAA